MQILVDELLSTESRGLYCGYADYAKVFDTAIVLIESKRPYSETSKDDKDWNNNNNIDDEAIDLLEKLVHLKRFNKPKYSSLLGFAGIRRKPGQNNDFTTGIASTVSGRTVINKKEQELEKEQRTNNSKADRSGRNFTETRANNVTNKDYSVLPGNLQQELDKVQRANNSKDQKGRNFTETRASNITSRNCSVLPGNLYGRETVDKNVYGMEHLEQLHKDFQHGGQWRPSNCSALLRVAIIIPYRNREQHLRVLLLNLIPKLQRQLIDFTIYVIEQNAGSSFNRGLIRNVGFLEARNVSAYDCYIFHDVDAIIEDDRNLYTCHTGAARHIAAAIDVNKYRLLYEGSVAGILSLARSDFEKVNGYSNFFFFWGGEDDNFYTRLKKHGIGVLRPPTNTATVTTLYHEKEAEVPERFALMADIENIDDLDGLKNIHYSNVTVLRQKLFTKISVNINQTLYVQLLMSYKKRSYLKPFGIENEKKSTKKVIVKNYLDNMAGFNNDKTVDELTENRGNRSKKEQLRRKQFLEMNSTAIMINRTGKVWDKVTDYIYQNVFDVCEITLSNAKNISDAKTTTFENKTSSNITCPSCSKGLRGRQKKVVEGQDLSVLEDHFNDFDVGGHWAPKWCKASKKLAIIIPYRDRIIHLRKLLYNLIPKLQRQLTDFTIYVVEQGSSSNFNRGLMKNIGFLQAAKDREYDCYIFNDVDTLIEDDRNIYTCVEDSVFHMAALVDAFKYKIYYQYLIGGILSVPGDVFRSVNGYTNFLFSWGGEDDELYERLIDKGFFVTRPELEVTKTTTFSHLRVGYDATKKGTLRAIRNFVNKDGLNTVRTEELTMDRRKLFTWIHAQVNETYYDKMLANYVIDRRIKLRNDWMKRKNMTTGNYKNLFRVLK